MKYNKQFITLECRKPPSEYSLTLLNASAIGEIKFSSVWELDLTMFRVEELAAVDDVEGRSSGITMLIGFFTFGLAKVS